MSILEGLRVVEISANGSAAWAGKHFADWGATVTIIEPAGGTPLRKEPPLYDATGSPRSATWQWLSRGKTSIRLSDRFSTTDARSLCESADVVLVEAELTRDVLGLAPSDVRTAFAGKTTCVLIAPFATDGPYADYAAGDLGLCALSGWMHLLGELAREPLRPGRGIVPRIAGISAFVAALIALRQLRQGGEPQYVELSGQALAASMIAAPWLVKSMIGFEVQRRGNPWPMGVMECKDGYVGCPPLTGMHWELLCQLMDMAHVLDRPEGRDPMYRILHGEELYEEAKPWLRQHTRVEIFEEAQAWRLPAAQVHTVEDRLACPQLAARDYWRTVEIDGKTVKTPRVTYSIDGSRGVPRGPLVEVDTVDPPSPRPPAHASAPNSKLPFEGLRILDLTSFWSGPYATELLGALGADVIKIESVQRPDPYRFTLAPAPNSKEGWFEWGPLFNDCNCNKRGVALDLTQEAGKELFERLVPHADVVMSNFSNRVLPNLGLTNQRLLKLNPKLIAVTMPGYGPGGPWQEYVGYAIAFEQLICGSTTGYADGVPSYAGGVCDPLVGFHTVAAIELALRGRDATGRGVEVEVPQCETLDSIFAPEQIAVQLGAPVPTRQGNKHDTMAPHDAFRCAGDDQWLTVAVATDAQFAALTNAIGLLDLATDARFATAADRKSNEAALDALLADALNDRDVFEIERELQSVGVAACHVNRAFELASDPGLQHIGFFADVTRPVTGTHAFKRWPFRFSSIDAAHKRPPPLLGQHTAEVLTELLALSDDDLATLEAAQVTGTVPTGLKM